MRHLVALKLKLAGQVSHFSTDEHVAHVGPQALHVCVALSKYVLAAQMHKPYESLILPAGHVEQLLLFAQERHDASQLVHEFVALLKKNPVWHSQTPLLVRLAFVMHSLH